MPTQHQTVNITPSAQVSTTGPVGGGDWIPSSVNYRIRNNNPTTINYTVTCAENWVTITPASGSIGPNTSVLVNVEVDADANALGAGVHSASIVFDHDAAGGAQTRVLQLTAESVALLTPGAGWGGPTSEPGQIGSGTAKAIARWDVVPYQTVAEEDTPTFDVGIVAFHIAGIEKVSFGVEGGSFVDVTEMSFNERTGVWEYTARLTLSDFTTDGLIELRAIAYPNAGAPQAEGTGAYPGGGYPRLLNSLFLYVDVDTKQAPNVAYCSPLGSDSTGDGSEGNPYASPWKAAQLVHTNGGGDAGGGIVYMDGGDYAWGSPGGGTVPATPERWLTFTPMVGVAPDTCRFTSNLGGDLPGSTGGSAGIMGIDKIRLKDLRISNTYTNQAGGSNTYTWADGVRVNYDTNGHDPYWQGVFGGSSNWYMTDGTFANIGGTTGRAKLARGIVCTNVTWAVGRGAGLAVNCIWIGVSNGPPIYDAHSDFISWNFCTNDSDDCLYENQICYGLKGVNLDTNGVFLKDIRRRPIKDMAIVNCLMDCIGSQGTSIPSVGMMGLEHFLFWNNTHPGGASVSMDNDNSPYGLTTFVNVSIRNNEFGQWQSGQQVVDDGWCDGNHFQIFNGFNSITPGTDVTTGIPGFVDAEANDFRPAPGSPLLNRGDRLVPGDATGAPRPLTGASCGALEP